MKVIVQFKGKDFAIEDVSKAMDIKKFRKIASEVVKCEEPKNLDLFFGGKKMVNGDDLCAYRVENGWKIIAIERKVLSEIQPSASSASEKEPESEKPENDEEKVSPDELKEKIKEIGGEDLLNEIEKEAQTNNEPAEPCKKCKDNSDKKCKECGCQVCGGKTPEERLIFCDECEYVTHFECLQDPIDSLPEGDWYCDFCRNDASEIVQAGEQVRYGSKRSKMVSRMKAVKRDWGRGMATAGRTKECKTVDKHHFGPIPGIDVGMCWQYRIQVSEVGIHRPPVAGIAGSGEKGCQSIVLAGGYEDDEDWGERFFYTGSGGRDLSGNKRVSVQSSDQTLTRSNKAIAINCHAEFNDKEGADAGKNWKKGLPIRVCRSEKFRKHSDFAPVKGIRYDGIYKVVKYWPHEGKSGHIVWRYEFKRDDESLPPWDENAPKFECIMKEQDDDKENKKNKIKLVNESDKNPAENKTGNIYSIEKPLQNLIDLDVNNKKLWDELVAKKVTKFEWYQEVEEAFRCPTCFEIMFLPVTLPCGHNICKTCLKYGFKNGHHECFTCRYKLEETFDIEAHLNRKTEKIMKMLFKTGQDSKHEKTEKKSKKPGPKSKRKRILSEDENSDNQEGSQNETLDNEKSVKRPKREQKSTKVEKESQEEDFKKTEKSEKPRKPGPKSKTKMDDAQNESLGEPKKSTKKYRPGPKSKKISEYFSKTPENKPGPSSKEDLDSTEIPQDDEISFNETPKDEKKRQKPGPKSKRKKLDSSEEEYPNVQVDAEDD